MSASLRFKLYVDSKITAAVKSAFSKDIAPGSISKHLLYGVSEKIGKIHLKLPYKSFKKLFPDLSKEEFSNFQVPADDILSGVDSYYNSENDSNIVFNINQQRFTEGILLNKIVDGSPEVTLDKKNIVLDYSSPNIAKPFHMGHLRSTIIGNFLANLLEHRGHSVTRLTYLGDWGTQFGVVQVGMTYNKMSTADIKRDPLKQLYDAYVSGNKICEAEEEAQAEARNVVTRMEIGDTNELMNQWQTIRNSTIEELKKTYTRLGINFDAYHWESMYSAKVFAPILTMLESKNLLETEDGLKVLVADKRRLPILKSDGSTLYLSREVAAALDRWNTYHFDRMLYVVDNSQHSHFTALKHVLHQLEYDWVDRLEHIKFGRIQGMSTRRGNVVFLHDILNEAKNRMADKQQQSTTTKKMSNDIADILGVTSIIVNDLKQRRMKDYNFDWNSALQADGDSGVKLQYTHCRLCSLEANSGISIPDHCDYALLTEPEAVAVLLEIARLEEAVERAYSDFEAHAIVNYLFKLCNKTSVALKSLNVKHQVPAIAEQRLLMFHTARKVLNSGMRMLGLQPLSEM